jgi:hypothetical protein
MLMRNLGILFIKLGAHNSVVAAELAKRWGDFLRKFISTFIGYSLISLLRRFMSSGGFSSLEMHLNFLKRARKILQLKNKFVCNKYF